MCNLKVLFFLSLFFLKISLLCGQIKDSCSMYSICNSEIDTVKLNVYKSIIQSKELHSNNQCHIVEINSISLDMKYSPGYEAMFYDIKEVKDSTSINNLRKSFSQSYKFYLINDKQSNSLNYFYDEICNNNFDVIKIQEPLDNWMKIYEANILLNKANVVIPVIYESYMNKPKYLLYKIELYEGSTKVKSVKAVELE